MNSMRSLDRWIDSVALLIVAALVAIHQIRPIHHMKETPYFRADSKLEDGDHFNKTDVNPDEDGKFLPCQ